MNNCSNLSIILGDCLPTTYDVAINIFNICPTPKSQKMKNCVHAYATALILQWSKAFGEEYVLKIKQVQSKLLTVVNDYYSKVYKKQTSGHNYFLSKDEAIQNQSELDLRTSLSTSSSSPLSIKPSKLSRLSCFNLCQKLLKTFRTLLKNGRSMSLFF